MDEQTRYTLLKHLDAKPSATQRELAALLGVSLGKLNYCLKALIDKGWIKVNNFSRSDNKRSYAYLLTPRGISEKAAVTVLFLQQKQMDHDMLVKELEELRREVATLDSVKVLE